MSDDVYQTVTDRIVAMLENADHGKWSMPWHKSGKSNGLAIPLNVMGRHYSGINIWLLLAAKMEKAYGSDVWATFQMWKGKGASVRKGEKATQIIFWQPIKIKEADPVTGEIKTKTIPLAKFYNVFNCDQVDGYAQPAIPQLSEETRIANADEFFANVPAIVRHHGNSAHYIPLLDIIELPEFSAFKTASGYYGTRGHETVHWTGHDSRLKREFGTRFGNDAYAFEELVAELGAAYLCAKLSIDNEPRPDHAAYLAHWIKRLKEDKRAIFTAASHAQKAVNYISELAGEKPAELEMAA